MAFHCNICSCAVLLWYVDICVVINSDCWLQRDQKNSPNMWGRLLRQPKTTVLVASPRTILRAEKLRIGSSAAREMELSMMKTRIRLVKIWWLISLWQNTRNLKQRENQRRRFGDGWCTVTHQGCCWDTSVGSAVTEMLLGVLSHWAGRLVPVAPRPYRHKAGPTLTG